MMDQLTASIEHIRSGRLKALAVISKMRSRAAAERSALDELGVEGYGRAPSPAFAPSAVPGAAAEKLTAALRRALSSETAGALSIDGVDIMDMSRGIRRVRAPPTREWDHRALSNIVVE